MPRWRCILGYEKHAVAGPAQRQLPQRQKPQTGADDLGRQARNPAGAQQPGKPQQNAYIERYNRTVRYDWLGQYLFDTIQEVQDHATRWLWTYNNERLNMALGGITPRQKLVLAA